MKIRKIIPDLMALYRVGVVSTAAASVLIHLARCGLHGATRAEMADTLGLPLRSLSSMTDRLIELGLVTTYGRKHNQGTAHLLVVSVTGWKLLTESAQPLDAFPSASVKPVL